MPLPTWYRTLRAFPSVAFGLFLVGFGIYLIVAPTSYRDPNNPKMVAYANSIHPVVIGLGAVFSVVGLFLLYVGYHFYNRMPDWLREYSYEQLRLGQALAREIVRLTKPEEFHSFSGKYADGSELYVSGSSSWLYKHRLLHRIKALSYRAFGESMSYHYSQPPVEVDSVLHVQELMFYLDSFTGKSSRYESVHAYEIKEIFPAVIDQNSPMGYAIKQGIEEGEIDEEEAGWLIEPHLDRVRVPDDHEPEIDEIVAHHRFMKQMGLDKPSVEELQIALDQLKEW